MTFVKYFGTDSKKKNVWRLVCLFGIVLSSQIWQAKSEKAVFPSYSGLA